MCTGSTPELAMNYIADITAKKSGGMYRIEDVPYDYKQKDWVECEAITKGKSPAVGIEGWTQLPMNNYQATMNAIAKV